MDPAAFNLMRAGYSVAELTEIFPIGRSKVYEAVKAGDLRATKFGKRTVFLASDVAAFLSKLQREAA